MTREERFTRRRTARKAKRAINHTAVRKARRIAKSLMRAERAALG